MVPVIAGERVAGGIATAADLAEELVDFVGEDAVIAEAAQELVLAVLWPVQESDAGGNQLGEPLGQLPQLEKAGIRIIGKIASPASMPNRRSCSSCDCRWAKLLRNGGHGFIEAARTLTIHLRKGSSKSSISQKSRQGQETIAEILGSAPPVGKCRLPPVPLAGGRAFAPEWEPEPQAESALFLASLTGSGDRGSELRGAGHPAPERLPVDPRRGGGLAGGATFPELCENGSMLPCHGGGYQNLPQLSIAAHAHAAERVGAVTGGCRSGGQVRSRQIYHRAIPTAPVLAHQRPELFSMTDKNER